MVHIKDVNLHMEMITDSLNKQWNIFSVTVESIPAAGFFFSLECKVTGTCMVRVLVIQLHSAGSYEGRPCVA